jgi:hypothetical protein
MNDCASAMPHSNTLAVAILALMAVPAIFGISTSANAVTVPDGRFNGATLCASASQACSPQLLFPANTQALFSHPGGTSSVTASVNLGPSPSLLATGAASGDANAQANITYLYFIELTGPSGTVALTVNTTGSATGSSTAAVVILNTASLVVAYQALTSGGTDSVFDNGVFLLNSAGTSFDRSDVVNITEGTVYEVAMEVRVSVDSSNPLGTSSVDPFFQFPVGYSLDISSGVGNSPLSETPLPAALPLFAGGLGFVGFLAKRRKSSKRVLAAA